MIFKIKTETNNLERKRNDQGKGVQSKGYWRSEDFPSSLGNRSCNFFKKWKIYYKLCFLTLTKYTPWCILRIRGS